MTALARAVRWRRMLETGAVVTVREIAVAGKINESYVSRVLRLTLLAREIVEADPGRAAGAGDVVAGVDGTASGGVRSAMRFLSGAAKMMRPRSGWPNRIPLVRCRVAEAVPDARPAS